VHSTKSVNSNGRSITRLTCDITPARVKVCNSMHWPAYGLVLGGTTDCEPR